MKVEYDPSISRIVIDSGKGRPKVIEPYDLRVKCMCAACVDEFNGKQILKIEQVPKDVYPTNIIKKGNYAVAIVWSDGHKSSVYPYERLLSNEI